MPHISVVIPVYKAENCLRELYQRLAMSLETITSDFEIILVEDCGGDRSWNIIVELANADKRVKGIQFSRNFGQHYGISAGLDYCTGKWVVVMDCDLQDRPEEIPRLYKMALEGYEVVAGKRAERKDSFYKRIPAWLYHKIFYYLADIKHDGEIGNFRIMSRNVVDNYCKMREKLRFYGGLVDWMGFPATTIYIQHDERFSGKSSYTLAKLWKLTVETIIAYSEKPLWISIQLGFVIATFAFSYGSYIMWRAFTQGIAVEGWSSLIVSVYFIGGIIIANLGVIGIYLGKTFAETKGRPLYIIRRTENLI
jgi:dolichol-phosphate mannosyltransferase